MITKSRENDAVQNFGENWQFSSIRIRKSRENEVVQNFGEIGNFHRSEYENLVKMKRGKNW